MGWLFGRKVNARTAPQIPSDMRVYVVGDVHGRHDLLIDVIEKIMDDSARPPLVPNQRIVFLGDYVDRGPQSREVIDTLLALRERALRRGMAITFLRGNHEAAMLDFISGPAQAAGWLGFGGRAALFSYGVQPPSLDTMSPKALAETAEKLDKALPPAHRDFLERLELSLGIGDYFFCHAGVRPGVPLDQQKPEDMLWIREPFLSSALDHGQVVVHGHTVVPEPEFYPNRIALDTGAYATGRLTCMVLSGSERRVL